MQLIRSLVPSILYSFNSLDVGLLPPLIYPSQGFGNSAVKHSQKRLNAITSHQRDIIYILKYLKT